MAHKSKIEWTDATWNPIRGCSRVSEGCRNCYAEKIAARFSGPGQPFENLARRSPKGVSEWTGELRLVESKLDEPLHWRKPRRIFVNSMSDLFHEKMLDEWIHRIWHVMAKCPQHTFQILTKRPVKMFEFTTEMIYRITGPMIVAWPLPNVWLGVSVEDQATANARIPPLLATPAAVRFVSYEPALGPVDFYWEWLPTCSCWCDRDTAMQHRSLCQVHGPLAVPLIDWIIAGGESGHGARPARAEWFGKVREHCEISGVPFFFKQWGEWIPVEQWRNAVAFNAEKTFVGHTSENSVMLRVGKRLAGRRLDGREWSQFPKVNA